MKKLFLLATAAMLGLGVLTGCDRAAMTGSPRRRSKSPFDQDDLKQIRSMVNEMLREDLPSGMIPSKCLKVKITKRIDKTHYRGIAMLDNGEDVAIGIELDGDDIIVKMSVGDVIYPSDQ